jgi:hypothetical protein
MIELAGAIGVQSVASSQRSDQVSVDSFVLFLFYCRAPELWTDNADQLQRAGKGTASAEALLGRVQAKVDDLCAQRDQMKTSEPRETKPRVLGGRKW